MIKSKESKEFHSKEKLLNMKKSPEPKEFQLKELSLTIMQLKLKLNIFQNKSNKLSLNMNQLKEFGKEFNIYQLKPKSFTIQKEITTFQAKENTSKLDTLKVDQSNKEDIQPTNKVPPTFHLKVELELKLFIKLDMSQLEDQLLDREDSFQEVKLNMFQEVNMLMEVKAHTPLEVNILLDKLNMFQDLLILLELLTPLVKHTLLVEVELEEKMSIELPKLEVTSLEEVELDNNDFCLLI